MSKTQIPKNGPIVIIGILSLFVVLFAFVFYNIISIHYLKQGTINNLEIKEFRYPECDIFEVPARKEICIIEHTICHDDDCFYNKALTVREIGLCNEINSVELKNKCKEVIFFNVVQEKVVFNDNISQCDSITDRFKFRTCRNNYYLTKAINDVDVNYCNKLDWPSDIVFCKNRFFWIRSLVLKDKSYCDKISVEAIVNECKN